MEDTTTTDVVAEQTSGGEPHEVIKGMQVDSDGFAIAETEPQPEVATESADDQTENTQPSSEAVETEEVAQATDGNSTELEQWAQKKGVDPNDPLAALKMARESEQAMHKATQEAAEAKRLIDLQTTMAARPSYDPAYADPNLDVTSKLTQDVAQLKAENSVVNFYAQNPEAREYDDAMASLVIQNPALRLVGIPTIYKLARADKMEADLASARNEGATEARKTLAKSSRASMPTSTASNQANNSNRLTMEKIDAMPFDEYQSRAAEIDAWLANGGR